MTRDLILGCVRLALNAIKEPRYYETERGFQGALLIALSQYMPQANQPLHPVLEQEYQKTFARHGLNTRPDIILHEPFDSERHADRTVGNWAVFELKLNSTPIKATKDFNSLLAILDALNYPLGIFINIASTATYVDLVAPEFRGRLVCFAVSLDNGNVEIVEDRA